MPASGAKWSRCWLPSKRRAISCSSRRWAADGPVLGEQFGVYQIVQKIGEGGMGVVYQGVRNDDQFRKLVAIKVVKRGMDTEYVLERFHNERQILAHFDHPNIAKLLDGGVTADGRPYVVMEFIAGRPIDEYCDAERLSVPARLELFLKVCSAVRTRIRTWWCIAISSRATCW